MLQRAGKDGCRAAEQGGLIVLIADDDPAIMTLMTLVTTRAGYRVIAATDGYEAIRLWESERPQVILMDVQMPVLNGFDATRRIRARERETGGQVPIYGLTAHTHKEVINRCLEAGMTGHIGKPVNFQELRETMKRYHIR